MNTDGNSCAGWGAEAVKPVLDLANNMRMVLVPGKYKYYRIAINGFEKYLLHDNKNQCIFILLFSKLIQVLELRFISYELQTQMKTILLSFEYMVSKYTITLFW